MLNSKDNDANIAGQHQEPADARKPRVDYLSAASEARRAGDSVLSMHLYMTAYEEACKREPLPSVEAVDALREAWDLACELRERSMAEYIYDKLEPHLSSEESQECGRRLQELALDKLSQFGISRSDLEDMADFISEEMGMAAHLTGIASFSAAEVGGEVPEEMMEVQAEEAPVGEAASTLAGAQADETGQTERSDQADTSLNQAFEQPGTGEDRKSAKTDTKGRPANLAPARGQRIVSFEDLVGFDGIIEDTRALGIGVKQDATYQRFIETLQTQHGLDKVSASGTVVFRTASREDASLFMNAVVGELGLPAMKVQMHPEPQGIPVLYVTVSSDRPSRMAGRMSLDAPGILVLEDVDMWGGPLIEAASSSEGEGMMAVNMARAAREALTLIGAAVANPDIYVLASMSGDAPDQSYLFDLMEPMNFVDIYLPNEVERREVWNRMALDHPSIRRLDLRKLTRLSRNLSRTDIATAAREAVEDAYRRSLKARRYVPLTQAMVYEHISNFQPLDSEEYRVLEDAVIASFRSQIDRLEAQGGITESGELSGR